MTDTERLDAVELLSSRYGRGWILRMSTTGRGLRLHETSALRAHPTVRAAIDAYVAERNLEAHVAVGR